jgi:uncharacterized protein YodC (DUF2158 family)
MEKGDRMETKYPVGTVVSHRASKQRMVVVSVLDDRSVRCHYRNEVTGNYDYEVFLQAELEADTTVTHDTPTDSG